MHSSDSDHSVPVSASCVWAKLQPYRRPFLILWIYTLLVQLPLLVLRLTNDLDGLWNQDDYLAGAWELSIGRWFWPFLDKMRFGISLDPLPAVFSLALYSLSFLLILRLLDLTPSGRNLLAGFLFLGSVGIVCQMSFGYMAITFAVSFFLAVLAVWALLAPVTSSAILRILLSALCIAFMMGSYQAGIGTTALLMIFVLLYSIAAEAGTPVTAAADGVVYTIYEDDSMGMTVVIRHEDGYVTRYSSLDQTVEVVSGQSVKLGQTIGYVGETALLETAEGSHVHFGVTCNDEPMDPAEFCAIGQ